MISSGLIVALLTFALAGSLLSPILQLYSRALRRPQPAEEVAAT